MKSLKPELAEIKPVDAMEEGQRILANVIANAYLHTKRESQAKSKTVCKTKDKEVQK